MATIQPFYGAATMERQIAQIGRCSAVFSASALDGGLVTMGYRSKHLLNKHGESYVE